jgi:hypothetical protein
MQPEAFAEVRGVGPQLFYQQAFLEGFIDKKIIQK